MDIAKWIEENTFEIDEFLFDDNSRLKVLDDNINMRLFVYSGIRLKQNHRRYNVNYFVINKYTGEIKYDYDQHYRRVIPSRHIIFSN